MTDTTGSESMQIAALVGEADRIRASPGQASWTVEVLPPDVTLIYAA